MERRKQNFSHFLSTSHHQHVCSHCICGRSWETLFASLSWPLLALFLFTDFASHWMHHPVYVQAPVEPTLKTGSSTTILFAPGSSSSLWFISNQAFCPALLHSEVLPLKHFAINGKSLEPHKQLLPKTRCHVVQWLLRRMVAQSCSEIV